VAAGGLPFQNRLLMQLTADITGREVDIAASTQAGAVGSAMHGAVAAGAAGGGYDSIEEAAAAMARPHTRTCVPGADAAATYARLHAEYRTLHDYFGRGGNDVMKRLRALQHEATRQPATVTGAPATPLAG
jgi:L-ribulokinase